MAIIFVRDEHGMVPQFNSALDGFGEILSDDLTTRGVTVSNIRCSYANVPKKALITMLEKAKVKFNKSCGKDDLLLVVQKHWKTILEDVVGVMGAHRYHQEERDDVTITPEGCGALFILKDKVIYPTWHPSLKGFAVIEWKALESIILKPSLDHALPQITKKSMEDMLAHLNTRVRTTGRETWNTTSRVIDMVKTHWDTIMEKAGFVNPYAGITENMAPPPAPARDEESDGDNVEFALFNPYDGNMEYVTLDPDMSVRQFCWHISQEFYRPDVALPFPCVRVLLPFGPSDEDGALAHPEPDNVGFSVAPASSATVPTSSPTTFTPFSGAPMKLGDDKPEQFYLNKKGAETVGEVHVLFPKHMGFSGKSFVFYFGKDDKWKVLHDVLSEKTPINLNEVGGYCLRLPNAGSKSVPYETIGSWASLPTPLRMEIDIELKGGVKSKIETKGKVKMVSLQKEMVLKLGEKMKQEARSADSVHQITEMNSQKMRVIWDMVEVGNSNGAIETIFGCIPVEGFQEMFKFNTSKPEQKLEHVATTMLKYYVSEVVKAQSALETALDSSASCLNLALKSLLVKENGIIDWESLKRMAEIEVKARAKSSSSDVNMG